MTPQVGEPCPAGRKRQRERGEPGAVILRDPGYLPVPVPREGTTLPPAVRDGDTAEGDLVIVSERRPARSPNSRDDLRRRAAAGSLAERECPAPIPQGERRPPRHVGQRETVLTRPEGDARGNLVTRSGINGLHLILAVHLDIADVSSQDARTELPHANSLRVRAARPETGPDIR